MILLNIDKNLYETLKPDQPYYADYFYLEEI